MNLQGISLEAFESRYGVVDVGRAICGFTPARDTSVVLALLVHARPRRIVEIGTAAGHMTANLTEWSSDEAMIYSLGTVADVPGTIGHPQECENPPREHFGRLANHFGKVHKVFFITADSLTYDFHRLAPIDFAFIDGAHEYHHVLSDSLKIYRELSPQGCMVWHDFDSPVAWVQVRQALLETHFVEPIYHVLGTEVAFLDRGHQPLVISH